MLLKNDWEFCRFSDKSEHELAKNHLTRVINLNRGLGRIHPFDAGAL